MARPSFEAVHGESPCALNVYLTQSIYERLERVSLSLGISKSQAIRASVLDYVEEIEAVIDDN